MPNNDDVMMQLILWLNLTGENRQLNQQLFINTAADNDGLLLLLNYIDTLSPAERFSSAFKPAAWISGWMIHLFILFIYLLFLLSFVL